MIDARVSRRRFLVGVGAPLRSAPPEGSWFRGCHNGDPWRVVAPAQIDFLGRCLAARSL
jgi:hypothetical protein